MITSCYSKYNPENNKHEGDNINKEDYCLPGVIEEIFTRIVEQSDRNPLIMAIIIARFAGMSYAQIANTFNTTKRAVHWHAKKIKNSELRLYLKQKNVSKHKQNSIKYAFLNGWYQPHLLPKTKYYRK